MQAQPGWSSFQAKPVELATRFNSDQLIRTEHAIPLLNKLEQWLGEQSFLPKKLIGKAATYTRNQWDTLNRYVEDGDIAIDNNPAAVAISGGINSSETAYRKALITCIMY